MATYTVRAGDTWFSLASKLGVDARTLKQQNRGTTLARGVVIRTGGARYTRPADINPWGLGVGIVPTSAYETKTGTAAAKKYLAAIGQPTAAPTGEVPGVTPVGEEPAITPSPGGVYDPATGQRYRTPTDVIAPTLGEPITMAGLTGAAIGPQQPLGPPGQPSPITLEPSPTTAIGAAPSIYPERPDLPEGMEPGQYVMGEGSPWGERREGPLTALGRLYGEATRAVTEGVSPPREIEEIPPSIDTRSEYFIHQTARAIDQAMRTGDRSKLPVVITASSAQVFLTEVFRDIEDMNALFSEDNLNYTEVEPGVWVRNEPITNTSGYTTYATSGRTSYSRGRSSRAAGGTRGGTGGVYYGPGLTQWRIRGFG